MLGRWQYNKHVDREAFERAKQEHTLSAYQNYLQVHPDGVGRSEAKAFVEEYLAWQQVESDGTVESAKEYLRARPGGFHAPDVEILLAKREAADQERRRRDRANAEISTAAALSGRALAARLRLEPMASGAKVTVEGFLAPEIAGSFCLVKYTRDSSHAASYVDDVGVYTCLICERGEALTQKLSDLRFTCDQMMTQLDSQPTSADEYNLAYRALSGTLASVQDYLKTLPLVVVRLAPTQYPDCQKRLRAAASREIDPLRRIVDSIPPLNSDAARQRNEELRERHRSQVEGIRSSLSAFDNARMYTGEVFAAGEEFGTEIGKAQGFLSGAIGGVNLKE